MDNEKVYAMSFAKVYLLLVAKAEKKGRTIDEPLMQEIRYLDKLIDELLWQWKMEYGRCMAWTGMIHTGSVPTGN